MGARSRVVPEHQLAQVVKENYGREVHTSFYRFTDDLWYHVQEKRSIAGFIGRYYVPEITWDIDVKTPQELGTALGRTRDLMAKLIGLGVNKSWIRVWFSGKRGFHLWTPDVFGFRPSRHLYEDVPRTLERFTSWVDTSVAGMGHMIRAPWSFHSESGLYKIPLTHEELEALSVEEIQQLATDPKQTRRDFTFEALTYEGETPLEEWKLQEEERETVAVRRGLSLDPDVNVTCMSRVWKRGPVEGERNSDLMEMVRAWRMKGMTQEQCEILAWAWIEPSNVRAHEKMSEYEAKRCVDQVFKHGYMPSCERPLYKAFCSEKCIYFKHKNVAPQVIALADGMDEYAELILQGEDHLFDLQEIYPKLEHHFTVQRGEVLLLIGDTKIGKTALFQNWAVQLPRLRFLNLSFEMRILDLRTRYVQIRHNLAIDPQEGLHEIRQALASGKHTPETLKRGIEHIALMNTVPAVDQIDQLIAAEAPDVVIIDPLEDITVRGSRGNTAHDLTVVIQELSQVAHRRGVVLLIVHHVNKEGMGQRRVELRDAKSVKAIIDKCDIALGFEGERFKTWRTVRTLAARRPQHLVLSLQGDPRTYRFYHYHQSTQLTVDEGPPGAAARSSGLSTKDRSGGGDSLPLHEEDLPS